MIQAAYRCGDTVATAGSWAVGPTATIGAPVRIERIGVVTSGEFGGTPWCRMRRAGSSFHAPAAQAQGADAAGRLVTNSKGCGFPR